MMMTRGVPRLGGGCGLFARRSVNSLSESIYCMCRMPDDGTKYIKCGHCLEWYHFTCMSIDDTESYHMLKDEANNMVVCYLLLMTARTPQPLGGLWEASLV